MMMKKDEAKERSGISDSQPKKKLKKCEKSNK
jgi:hypothetical protein